MPHCKSNYSNVKTIKKIVEKFEQIYTSNFITKELKLSCSGRVCSIELEKSLEFLTDISNFFNTEYKINGKNPNNIDIGIQKDLGYIFLKDQKSKNKKMFSVTGGKLVIDDTKKNLNFECELVLDSVPQTNPMSGYLIKVE